MLEAREKIEHGAENGECQGQGRGRGGVGSGGWWVVQQRQEEFLHIMVRAWFIGKVTFAQTRE